MPDIVAVTQNDEGVPRWRQRERPQYPRGFMADSRKTYRLPTRADIRPGGDLRDTDLIHAELRGIDLSGADLFQADLRDADLTGATLTGACLYGADLSGARIDGADLSGAELFNAALGKATFDRAILKGATINTFGSWVKGPASMRGADLSGAILFWCEMAGVDLTGANLTGAVVRAPGTWQRTIGEDGGTLAGAVLDGAILDDLVAVSDWPRRAKYRTDRLRPPREHNFPAATRTAALARAGNRCEQCQATGRLEVDHVVAVADGGAETIDNAQVLCRTCHVAKTTRDLRERELQQRRDEALAAKARWVADKPARDADLAAHLAAWHARKAARAEAKPARDAHLAAWRARKAAREARKVASVNPEG